MRRGTWAVVVTGLLAAPAFGQLASGYSGFEGIREARDDEAWWSLEALGPCMVKQRPREAQALLATTPGTQQEADAGRRLLGKYTMCLKDMKQMRLSTSILRGVIAEAAYEAVPARALPERPHERPARMTVAEAQKVGPYGLLARMSACMADRAPNQVAGLLKTKMGSGDQDRAMSGMTDLQAACTPEKMQLNFGSSEVRLALAEAMLKRRRASNA